MKEQWLESLHDERENQLKILKKTISVSDTILKIFPKQSLSFSYADSCHQDVHIFAFEDEQSIDGSRKYLVSILKDFWNVYRDMKDESRSFYEVIRESMYQPKNPKRQKCLPIIAYISLNQEYLVKCILILNFNIISILIRIRKR
jgi:predicted CopG family antitoxin